MPIARSLRHASWILLSLVAVAPASASAGVPQENRRVAVVEHAGDVALRDRLIASAEVWYDAGEFLVGNFTAAELGELDGQGVPARAQDIGECDELLVIAHDGREPVVGRVLHTSPRQMLVTVPAGIARPPSAGRHGQAVLVPRQAMRPCPPAPAGGANLLVADPRIQAIVNQVDPQNVLAKVQSLSAITSRRATTAGATQAQGLVVGWLQGFGLTTSLQNFGTQYSKNVIAEIPGILHPNRYVVLGAHYDSINHSGSTAPAPGADDNASGTGGVIEAARVLSAAGPFENTIRFVLFSAEELGLIGSDYAAQRSQATGEQIVGMLNLDMLAYREAGDARDVDFATNNTNAALTAQCRQIGATYVPGWASTTGTLTAGTSDHQSYFTRGYPAAFPFEDMAEYSPYIHTASDTYPQSTNDPELARMIVQGMVATVATLAVPTCTPPANYCVAAPNSTGSGAVMLSSGSTSVAVNDLTLLAYGCRPGANGLFFWGVGETQVPLGNGFRCVGSSIVRLGFVTADVFGDVSLAIDLNGYPGGPLVAPGDVRNAQLWYRDVAGGGAGYNLSDARRLTFCP